MKKIPLLLFLFGLTMQSHALANEPYMEFQFGYVEAKVADEKVHPSLLTANFGYPLSRYMGIEIVIGAGLRDDQLKIKTLFGTYISANLPVSYSIDVFGRAGISNISYEYKTTGSDLDASFGLGAALLVSAHSSISLELRTFPKLDDDKISLNAIMLGWKYK